MPFSEDDHAEVMFLAEQWVNASETYHDWQARFTAAAKTEEGHREFLTRRVEESVSKVREAKQALSNYLDGLKDK
ncbi:hypothetical protein [Longispora urticae]